jgi:hypothetical protein
MRFQPSAVRSFFCGTGLSVLGFSGATFLGSEVFGFFLKKREII